MTSRKNQICVVVVAYGAPHALERCLAPLQGFYPVMVIDNSSDPACALVARAAGARYVDTGSNLGFAGAVNRAIDLVDLSTQDVLLLNPDAVIDRDAVEHLGACICAPGSEHVAALAPRQHGDDSAEQRVTWPFPSPTGAWADALALGRLLSRWSFVVGSVLLVRGRAITDVGRFDERFFLYAEEADWQRRAHLRGWAVRVCEHVIAYHAGGATPIDPAKREALFHASYEALMRKWYGRRGWWSARTAAIVGTLARTAWRWRDVDERRAESRRFWLYVRGPSRVAAGQHAP